MSHRILSATLFRQDTCALSEGPFWHDGQLWWVNIEGGALRSADRDGKLIQNITFGQRIGSACPTTKYGIFLVALEREIALLHLDSERRETISRPHDVPANSRFNDGKCDPAGRWIGGTMNHAEEKTCSLYALHHDHSLQRLRGDLVISNGLAWSADGRTMYHIDTPTRCVFAFDYDVATGSISGERVVLRFSEKEGWPDGMTIDREDRLWIAFWDGSAVRCYRPETGVCETVVQLPCTRVSSCCFGGDDLNLLFITTAREGLSDSELAEQPLAGSLFVCDPGTTGFPTTHFKSAGHRPPAVSLAP
jgi:sugar lactone lactonase YvrE